MISVFGSKVGSEELDEVKASLEAQWMGIGPKTKAFEEAFAKRLALPGLALLDSGSNSLYMAIKLLRIPAGSEIIVPSLTWIACAHAVVLADCVPVFCDVELATQNASARTIEPCLTQKTAAVMVVHYAGKPVEMDAVLRLGKPVIEDAAHAVDSYLNGKACGSMGAVGIYSFDAVKNLAMGEGGGVTAQDPELVAQARLLRYCGIGKSGFEASADKDRWWEYQIVDFMPKFLPSDVHAAIGLAQLRKLDALQAYRKNIWELFQRELAGVGWLARPEDPGPHERHSYFTYFVRVLNGKRDRLAKFLYEKGIYTTLRYHPLHMNPIYKSSARLPNSERLNEEGLNLPLHPNLSESDLDQILSALRSFDDSLNVKPPVVILGGGCAGLAAGLRLAKRGHRIVLIERADHVGGLAGGVQIGANTYEYGPHAFHTTDPEILGDIKGLMGEELIEYHRSIKIRFLGRYFQFPLTIRDVLFRLPVRTVFHAGASFLWHFVRGFFSRPTVENSETLLMRYYGRVLYEIFFKSYIVKVWGISPAEFSPAFARERIPRLNLLDFVDRVWSAIKRRLGGRVSTEGYVEKVEGKLYTTKRGFSLITQRMAEGLVALGGEVLLDNRVTRIVREGALIRAVEIADAGGGMRKVECSGVVNTLPLNETTKMVSPPLERAVLDAASKLKFRALVFVGVLVKRPRALLSSFMYFRENSFNRIADLSQFGFEIEPPGCSVLVAEISCSKEERYWTDDEYAKQAVMKDLLREGVLTREEVLGMHVFRAEHAYPIYTLGYEQHRNTLIDAIERTANMETAGRQGRFAYVNTHIAMKMGYEAADRLLTKMERKR